MHRLETIKDNNISRKRKEKETRKKTHLLLQILAVIGRHGPHLLTVMILGTRNNF